MSTDPKADNKLLRELTHGFSKEDAEQIEKAFATPIENTKPIIRPKGSDVALILHGLGVDATTLVAALLSDPRLRDQLDENTIEEHFGKTIASMVNNVNWLNTFNVYSPEFIFKPDQAETLRRMLLAMIDDVRAVLIKLAYRVQRLRILPHEDYEVRLTISQETLDIYSPLANRLGIGQLKWKLEDLAFRYLEPQLYKKISNSLTESRADREAYLVNFISELSSEFDKHGIQAKIQGRPKHIYSIRKKMQRKKVDFVEVYDLRAVRIIVDKVATCYTALGIAHGRWQYVPQEFDDYIANPKPNGYQSLHTVIVGPDSAMVEIQIRTRNMHHFAELGVAAHWRYKEGGKQDTATEKTIASIRRLLENKDDDNSLLDDFRTDLYTDRIFVLTPKGELKDMLKGSTPLDFAYAVHTEVGHRCRGAKINGRIVPLTYALQSGEQIEILTAKEGSPSHNWLEPHLGYLKTSHARSKVRHWFREQDHEKNARDGKTILEKERQRLNINEIDPDNLLNHFHLSKFDDLLIRIGRADITVNQLAEALDPREKHDSFFNIQASKKPKTQIHHDDITVQGVGNLMTNFAQCCKPLPGDLIIGYITVGKGIAIHRQDCTNILQITQDKENRLVDVTWGHIPQAYPVDISVRAFDRQDLLRDITQILSNEHVNIQEASTHSNIQDQTVNMTMTLEIKDTTQLSQIIAKIGQLRNVLEAKRR